MEHTHDIICGDAASVLDRLEDVAQFQVIGPSPFALGRWPDRGSLVLNQDWQHQALR